MLIVCCQTLFAYDFEVNGIYYFKSPDVPNTLMVTRGEVMYSGDVVIPATVEYDGTAYSVTEILSEAFLNCGELSSITLPNSLTVIGKGAFANCTALTSVTIPNSVTNIKNYAFNGCTALASVTLGNSVERIGCCSFGGSKELTSITLPASLTGLNSDAFMYSSSLAEVNVDKDNLNYCSVDGVVLNKEKTQLVLFPDGYNKTETYTIPNTVTDIWASVFVSCKTITGIIIPSSVTQISSAALISSCIKSITVDKDNPNYCSVDGVMYNKDKTTLEAYPGGRTSSEYVIPSSVTTIAANAFTRCSSLTSVTIPNSVKTIGMQAFTDCVGLASLEIPNSVETIGMSAFAGCVGLKSVTISNSLKTLITKHLQAARN